MSEIEKMHEYIEENIFKIIDLEVSEMMVKTSDWKPHRTITVSLEFCPECKQDVSATVNKELEDRIKAKLGSMICDEIEKQLKVSDV